MVGDVDLSQECCAIGKDTLKECKRTPVLMVRVNKVAIVMMQE